MAKFATPVAMKVTKEQGKYLLDKLISMGYEENGRDIEGYIATNWNDIHYAVAIASKKPRRRYIIEEYNPELFLAIAAMTEGDMPIKGEWLYFDKPFKIFQVKVLDTHNNWRSGTISVDNPTGCGNFHKPTIQQLVEHFKISANYKEFVLPKKWKLEVTVENVAAVNKWRASKKKYFIVKPGHAVDQDGHWGLTINTISTENTEIATKQFMEHVYKPTFNKEIPEELINHFTKSEETFKLPKKWKLEVTKENVDAVNKWKASVGYNSILSPHDYVDQLGLYISTPLVSPLKTITTEQFMEHVYNPTFNKIPEEFYIHYCEGFTEDIFNALYDWAKVHSSGKIRGYNDTYELFISDNKFWRFNFVKDSNDNFGYGVDNHNWSGRVKTKYTLEQVKELINYKLKTNKNEYKEEDNYESSYEREIRESFKQIAEDLGSFASREGGKEIKIRTVSSRNLCERGSFSSSEKIARTRRTSSRIRAEKGDFNF